MLNSRVQRQNVKNPSFYKNNMNVSTIDDLVFTESSQRNHQISHPESLQGHHVRRFEFSIQNKIFLNHTKMGE